MTVLFIRDNVDNNYYGQPLTLIRAYGSEVPAMRFINHSIGVSQNFSKSLHTSKKIISRSLS